jgi:integrase
MRLIRPTHDPKKTPFIERLDDVRRIFLALPEPLNVAYAIGALAGLRTGEVFALRWTHLDLAARRIHVRESINGPLKDNDSRIVPVLDALLPILTEWKFKSGSAGRVIPPMRCDGKRIDKATPAITSASRSRSSSSRSPTSAGTKRRGTPSPRSGFSQATRSRSCPPSSATTPS